MNSTTPAALPPSSALAARYRAYHRNMRLYYRNAQIGAVALLSTSTLRALSKVEHRQAQHLTRSIVDIGRTNDSTTDGETLTPERDETGTHAARSAVLAPSERAALLAARPASRSVVWRKPAAVVSDDPEGDQPLPAGYVAAPVPAYESAFLSPSDPEVQAIEAAAAIEAGIEITAREVWDGHCEAASRFVSDYSAPAPEDFTPYAAPLAPVIAVQAIAPVTVAPGSLAMTGDPITDHAALLRAILGNAKPRRATMAAR